jgi:hypothetical protein
MRKILLALLLSFLLTGANGLDVKFGGGSEAAGTFMGTNYGANVGDYVDHHMAINPTDNTGTNAWSFSGPGSTYRYVYGRLGGFARSGFSITGSSARTTYDFASSNYPYALVRGYLTSRYANYIYAYAYASSNNGNQAMAKIQVYSPSNNAYLVGYSNSAYATSTSVQVSQAASSAGASSYSGYILTDLWATRSIYTGIKTTMSPLYIRDSSEVVAKMSRYPALGTYPNTWSATAYATSTNTLAQQGIYAYGYPIVTQEYAKKYGYSGILRTQTNYGTHRLGQGAYTSSTGYGVSYPHWA